jgi:hypothetical protein
MRRPALLAAALAAAAVGCGSHARRAATGSSSTATAPPPAATTGPVSTTGSTMSNAGTTTVATTALSPRKTYQARMQARIDVATAQCYSSDPGVAARQALRRYRTALGQLQGIQPPPDAAHAHRELISVMRIYVGMAARRVAPSEKLAALIVQARADGQVSPDEQARIQRRQQALLLKYLPPRSAGKREGDALRDLRRKGYDVEPKGPPKRGYVRRAQALIDAAGNPAKSFTTTTSAASLRAQLRRQRAVAWRSARTLDDITPPEQVSYAQQQLVGALCDRGRLYDDLERSLERRSTPQLVRFSLVNARQADAIGSNLYRSAMTEYRRAGYAIRAASGPPH